MHTHNTHTNNNTCGSPVCMPIETDMRSFMFKYTYTPTRARERQREGSMQWATKHMRAV